MDFDMPISLSPDSERALGHITVHMDSAFTSMDAALQHSKSAKTLEVVVTEIKELQCELEVTDADTDLTSAAVHELEENRGIDEVINIDASITPEEATSLKADAVLTEKEEDMPEVEGSDVTIETMGSVENVENTENAEIIENLVTRRIAPKRTAWLAGWLEEAAYWENDTWNMFPMRRWNTI